MEEFGRHTALELHGRVYLDGHYMAGMTFEDACNVARFRHDTEPQIVTEVDTGRFLWSVIFCLGVVGLLLLSSIVSNWK